MASPLKSPYCQPAKAQSDLWAMGLKSLSPQEKLKKKEEEQTALEVWRQAPTVSKCTCILPHQRGLPRSSCTLFPNGRSCPMVASGVAECSFCERYFCLSLLKPPVQLYSATRLAGEGEGGC
jgi:hypothetical protein